MRTKFLTLTIVSLITYFLSVSHAVQMRRIPRKEIEVNLQNIEPDKEETIPIAN